MQASGQRGAGRWGQGRSWELDKGLTHIFAHFGVLFLCLLLCLILIMEIKSSYMF